MKEHCSSIARRASFVVVRTRDAFMGRQILPGKPVLAYQEHCYQQLLSGLLRGRCGPIETLELVERSDVALAFQWLIIHPRYSREE